MSSMQETEPEEEMSENAPTTPETPATPPRKRRRWLKIVLISVAVVVVGGGAASAAYIYSIDSVTQNIKREHSCRSSRDPPRRDPARTRRPLAR